MTARSDEWGPHSKISIGSCDEPRRRTGFPTLVSDPLLPLAWHTIVRGDATWFSRSFRGVDDALMLSCNCSIAIRDTCGRGSIRLRPGRRFWRQSFRQWELCEQRAAQWAPPFAPGYFNGRFSNGPTWIEVLSDPALSTNPDSTMNRFWSGFLFGGPYDVGGNVNNVNAAIGFAETVGAGPPPSIQTQIGAFLAAGGVFGPNDLVSVQGGAKRLPALHGT